jgi:hypothetical protein
MSNEPCEPVEALLLKPVAYWRQAFVSPGVGR